MLGNHGTYLLPGRLFRHASNFDFMISFKDFTLDDYEKESFIELIKKEIRYSRDIEEMTYESRSKDRKRYFMLQKELNLKKI